MRTAMRPRYYCDHCKKGNGSPSYMKRHERGCTLNPNRVCGMCALMEDAGLAQPAPPRDELLRVMGANGFKAMCDAANHCPACVLSALRTLNTQDEFGEPIVAGPDDGRQEWNYASEKKEWWFNWNSRQYGHEHQQY